MWQRRRTREVSIQWSLPVEERGGATEWRKNFDPYKEEEEEEKEGRRQQGYTRLTTSVKKQLQYVEEEEEEEKEEEEEEEEETTLHGKGKVELEDLRQTLVTQMLLSLSLSVKHQMTIKCEEEHYVNSTVFARWRRRRRGHRRWRWQKQDNCTSKL